jgi:hypothetical protein
MFVVEAVNPTSAGWESRSAELQRIAGRSWDSAWSSGGVHACIWYCDSLGVAIELRNALLKVAGVSVVAREPMNGR